MANCNPKEEFNFYGKWQSLNDKTTVVEIDKNNNYFLFRNGKSFYDDLIGYGNLKINIKAEGGNWSSFKIISQENGKTFLTGKFEIVNNDRIRIYFYKHHQILDKADEFHRTDDFSSFDKIMDEIINKPNS